MQIGGCGIRDSGHGILFGVPQTRGDLSPVRWMAHSQVPAHRMRWRQRPSAYGLDWKPESWTRETHYRVRCWVRETHLPFRTSPEHLFERKETRIRSEVQIPRIRVYRDQDTEHQAILRGQPHFPGVLLRVEPNWRHPDNGLKPAQLHQVQDPQRPHPIRQEVRNGLRIPPRKHRHPRQFLELRNTHLKTNTEFLH